MVTMVGVIHHGRWRGRGRGVDTLGVAVHHELGLLGLLLGGNVMVKILRILGFALVKVGNGN